MPRNPRTSLARADTPRGRGRAVLVGTVLLGLLCHAHTSRAARRPSAAPATEAVFFVDLVGRLPGTTCDSAHIQDGAVQYSFSKSAERSRATRDANTFKGQVGPFKVFTGPNENFVYCSGAGYQTIIKHLTAADSSSYRTRTTPYACELYPLAGGRLFAPGTCTLASLDSLSDGDRMLLVQSAIESGRLAGLDEAKSLKKFADKDDEKPLADAVAQLYGACGLACADAAFVGKLPRGLRPIVVAARESSDFWPGKLWSPAEPSPKDPSPPVAHAIGENWPVAGWSSMPPNASRTDALPPPSLAPPQIDTLAHSVAYVTGTTVSAAKSPIGWLIAAGCASTGVSVLTVGLLLGRNQRVRLKQDRLLGERRLNQDLYFEVLGSLSSESERVRRGAFRALLERIGRLSAASVPSDDDRKAVDEIVRLLIAETIAEPSATIRKYALDELVKSLRATTSAQPMPESSPLARYSFRDAKLDDVDWREVDAREVDFSRASLECADLSRADLRGADFRGAETRGLNRIGARTEGAKFDARLSTGPTD
jgi:hypothetical protein